MPHVVLLGDSIFDNGAYTGGQPDVLTHLRGLLDPSWKSTLLAVDGATTGSFDIQVKCIPTDATHLVVALGGNDALVNIDLLSLPVQSTAEVLALLDARGRRFEKDYARAIGPVAAIGRPVTLCTIYDGNLADPWQRAGARTALTLFNDVILRFALQHGTRVIDLRLVCTDPVDYANVIEPSGHGGLKIARQIARAVSGPGDVMVYGDCEGQRADGRGLRGSNSGTELSVRAHEDHDRTRR
jgi:GDSL-like lipase/acylhydrolase family protein